VGLNMEINEGDKVLDFCAGSGGKALTYAPRMNGKGKIVLWDVRESILKKARERCNRAGV
jgi:16S rRNA (cytosine967-C5)-methyltransferase